MANIKTKKGVIGILTGGGDVPGLNPAIRAVTIRAIREGFQVVGIRKGWEGMITLDRSKKLEEQDDCIVLTEQIVNKIGRTGGTFLHTSRTRPDKVKLDKVPALYKDTYKDEMNDLTGEVMKNIDYLGLDYLIPIGGDDTLSYGVHMHKQGMKVIAIPKTMDNDVPGTDYCIGFGTCLTRTIELAHELRTPAGSHERFLVIEVFGRYAGFTALLPTMAGAANRCVIPEHDFDIEKLTELMVKDRNDNPSKYSVLLVSEGAVPKGGGMMFEGEEADAYGHKKLGGIGDYVSEQIKNVSKKFNNGKKIEVINQRMGYLVRSGAPDALDSIVPMAYGNLALDLILKGTTGRLVALRNGRYDNIPVEVVTSYKKKVDVNKFYDTSRYRPKYEHFEDKPQLIMTSDY
ncbi:MAG: ATP-dependent 6-phosphofructokinase [Bacteroidetes bacterium]|nr:ATP-dependent 6-phosphofructokinase [Bacteroidota bacterium]